ncbi:MAG: hypothetical protein ABF624_00075 [Liquorilactobacillus ghanensis]|uniref:hypothetical protein n=1 Tax=Liquorilactobacillus ghanensis TaxID=399370 RepID=UPI0039E733A8
MFKKCKQKNKDEFQDVGMNHVGHGGLIVKPVKGGPNPFPLPKGNQLEHLISPSKLVEYKIDYEHYNKVIEYINKSLKKITSFDETLIVQFKNDYELNTFESVKLIDELRTSKYGFIPHWNGPQLYAVDFSL